MAKTILKISYIFLSVAIIAIYGLAAYSPCRTSGSIIIAIVFLGGLGFLGIGVINKVFEYKLDTKRWTYIVYLLLIFLLQFLFLFFQLTANTFLSGCSKTF